MISSKVSNPDTTYFWSGTDYDRSIMMNSRTHTLWISQDTSQKDGHYSGGGRYTLEGDKYTEHIEFFYDPKWIGKSVTYTFKVKGDTMIVSGIHPLKKWGFAEYDDERYEVYKRVD